MQDERRVSDQQEGNDLSVSDDDTKITESDEAKVESDSGIISTLAIAVGALITLAAGGAMLVFWFGAMVDWLGVIGGVLAVVFAPVGGAVFPFVYWAVEGTLPVLYLALWGLGWVGMLIAYLGGVLSD